MKQKDYFYDRASDLETDPSNDPWDDPTYDPWAGPTGDEDDLEWGAFPFEEIPPPTDADCPPERDEYGEPLDVTVTHTDASALAQPAPKPTHTDASALAQPTSKSTSTTIEGITRHCAVQMPSSCITFHPKLKMPVVDEWAFVQWFSEFAEMRCINYRFYLFGTKVTVGELKRMILEIVRAHAEINAAKLSGMVSLLESFTVCSAPVVDAESISFANKTLILHHADATPENESAATITLRMQQSTDFSFCRVPHNFDANVGEPTRLLAFLNGLFAPKDLPTVQEYLGYCLMPSTKAQKALFIIGKGGEGKSRLSVLMKLVLGEAAVVSSVAKISERFFPCMLENRLLFIDDDLQTTKFAATDAFKSLVTSETAIMVEQKGTPHYEMQPYARFLLMGNQSIGSLHDKSHGFYRRVHIIHTLPAPKGRVNNPTLIQDIWAAEQAEILLWLVKGALRLARQNYQLTESEASRAALVALKEEDNTALSFLKEQTFTYGAGCSVTSSMLTARYKEWCLDNDLFKVGGQAFKQTCEAFFAKHGGEYSRTVSSTLGRVRGYTGVALSC